MMIEVISHLNSINTFEMLLLYTVIQSNLY